MIAHADEDNMLPTKYPEYIKNSFKSVRKRKFTKLKMVKIFEQAYHKEEIHKANMIKENSQNH